MKLDSDLLFVDASDSHAEAARTSQGAADASLEVLAEPLQQLIDDLPEQIAVLDHDGIIFVANRAWRRAAEDHGYLEALPKCSYRDFCAKKAAEGYEPAIEALAAFDDMRSGMRSFWQLVYNGRENWRGRDYQISFHNIAFAGRRFVLVTRFDLTEIFELRRVRDEFAASLIEVQAVERQRLGRELHDSGSQLLTAIGLLLGRLRQHSPGEAAGGLIDEMEQLLAEVHQEIRSISYLAHPPSLKKLGLPYAVKSLVEGFGRRTGLEASFDIRGDYSGLPEPAEGALYRLAQEALSNVHRHAHASRVSLQLTRRGSTTHFVVADNGVGIDWRSPFGVRSEGEAEGVGLAGMRSRLTEVGGRLRIRGLSPGTAIIATVPNSCPAHLERTSPPALAEVG